MVSVALRVQGGGLRIVSIGFRVWGFLGRFLSGFGVRSLSIPVA